MKQNIGGLYNCLIFLYFRYNLKIALKFNLKPVLLEFRSTLKALLHYALFHLHVYFSCVFSCALTRVLDTNMLVSKRE